MTERRLWDVSQPLAGSTPTWPGDTMFACGAVWTHGPGSPVSVAQFTSSTHMGTHADAPLHYDPGGAAIDAIDLAPYIGRARVIDLRGAAPVITPDLIAGSLDGSVERVLLRTYERFPHTQWHSAFATIAASTIALLASHGVRLIGIDSPSLDPEDSREMAAHHAVAAADMRILEGLVLDDVPAGDYELIALPLRLTGLDASPVRAVLRRL